MSISSTASSAASARSTRSSRSRSALVGLWVVALSAGWTEAAAVQDPNLVDQGRYDIRVGDRAAGTETFAIRRQGEGYMAVGRVQVEGAVGGLRSAKFGLLTDGSFAPVRYETRAVGDEHSLIAIRTGTRFRITTSGAEGDRMTELLANPNQILLAEGIAQHYYFLVRRLSAGGPGRLTALVPGEGREAPITVAGTSDVTLDVGGESVPARRWELSIGGTSHLVWSSPANGRILRVEVPDRRWQSVLRPGE